MAFQFLTAVREQKIISWASAGLIIFISAFLWVPSRDGLQGVYLLGFFLPTLIILTLKKFSFDEYGGWPTILALTYAGFSLLSTLWGEPKDFGFFLLQWCVLASWLCGSCLVFIKREINVEKYLEWFVAIGVLATIIAMVRYYFFVFGVSTIDNRLSGWNVFRNPNEIGAMCGIIALLAFNIGVRSSSLKRVWLFYLLTSIATLGLVASFSRSALSAFIIMSFITLLLARPPLKVWLPPVLISIIALLLLLDGTQILDYYYTAPRNQDFGGRFGIWQEVLYRSSENIFIGIGMTEDASISIASSQTFNHAHNAWLDTLYRTGLIGLTLLLLHTTAIFQKASRDPRLLPIFLWLGFGCLCNLLDGRCFFWEIGAKWFLYWIPAGLIVAITTGIKIRALQTNNSSTIKSPLLSSINSGS
ncbi:MAG: O-antigen ligase family protein [Pseudomonadota bacterium]